MPPTQDFVPPELDITSIGLPSAALPPWPLKATLWAFIYSDTSAPSTQDTTANANNTPAILQGAPPGAYHPYEVPHAAALAPVNDAFQLRGGLRTIFLVRYTDTPVGPYDELAIVPGTYTRPTQSSGRAMRVTNIYVSTDVSVFHGRRYWNIQKHRADFVFEKLDDSRTAVRVLHPRGSPLHTGTPFFSAVLTASRLPLFPLPPMSLFTLVQPPLASPRYAPGEMPAVVGTDDTNPWLSITPSYKGRWGLAWIEKADAEDAYGDGVGFPELKGLWSVGAVFDGIIQFPLGKIVD